MAQDNNSVITQAVDGIGVRLAKLYGLTEGRMYQILVADNYGKTKRLIRLIALISKDRARLIKADIDAFFAEVLGDEIRIVSDARLHSELSDAIQAKLMNKPRSERLRECREAVDVLNLEIQCLQKEEIYRDNFTN